ncbi:methylcytosine dioxygenase TET2-like, partial [Scleropages formosus]
GHLNHPRGGLPVPVDSNVTSAFTAGRIHQGTCQRSGLITADRCRGRGCKGSPFLNVRLPFSLKRETEDSPVDGPSAGQMETEKASHEAQDRLTSVSPKTFHRSEHQVAKLQNGNQLSGGFPKQVNGDATWNHFKCYTGEGQMKRCRETCSVSPGMQEMLDQSPYLTNGEANHAFPEPSLLEICRSKKLKVDANINGKEDDVMDKTEPVCVESELGCFSHFSKKAEFDCDVLVEQKQVKESCISTDNGIFSFLRNKPMTVPNGATLTSPCMKGPHGDLITKPLCQYYSDHVTHLPHDPTPQENATKHLSEESVPQQAMHSPSLTSGLPILPKISTSGQLEEVSLDLGNNGRYNITLAMDPQQSQQRDGPLQEVPEATATESLSEVKAGLVCGTDICPSNIEETKSSSPSTDQSMLKVMEGKVLDAEQNPLGFNRGILLQKCQQQMEYGTLQQTESQRQHESHSLQGFASSDRLSYQPTPGELIEDVQNSSCDPGPQACYVENRAQQDRTDSDTSFKGEEASGIPKVLKAYHRKDLIDLNSFPLPKSWKTFGSQPQPGQQDESLGSDPGCMIPQTGIKTEQKEPCSQLQGQLGEYQKHAALRMHLLQKQQHPQNLDDFKHLLQAIKTENGPKLEALVPQHGQEVAHPRLGTLVKQEQSQVACDQLGQKSIIATMEHQLSQYQLPSSLLQDKSLAMKSVNKVKLETSGPVTILSMHANLECRQLGGVEQKKLPSDLINTKKLAPNLSSFLESPIKLLDTPIKNLLETPMKTQYEIPSCHCVEQISERDEGPYYTHLGAAPNVAGIRELMEKRFGQAGSSIRIEKVVYTGKEGKSTQGCPIAKWVIRRASVEEKLLVLVRERAGHTCSTAAMVVAILIWEGIPTSLADQLYTELSDTLTRHGALTNRRCALNEERTCACQGLDPERCGASFSFGCSWSMYYNGCKFARSKFPRKFKLLGDDPKEARCLNNESTLLAPKYKQMAPDAYSNQIEHENRALSCRLGLKEGRPFSGVTACLDFCAHAHRDLHNMQGGSTVVCTLTREDNREIGKIPEDEQLHVLPLYKISQTDEFGKVEGQESKVKSGAIQVLSVFRRQVRMLSEPAKSCRQRKLEGKRGGANKSSNQDTPNSKGEKALQAKLKQENIALSTSLPGPQPVQGQMGAVGVGHQPQTLNVQLQQQQQQHQQQQQISNPTSSHSVQLTYPRIPNHSDPFLGSSQPNVFCKSPAGVGSYPSPLHVTNPHMNGSHPPSSYAGSFNTSNVYLGYRCNGSIPVDTYNPFYPPDPKHLSILQQQRPPFYSQQLAAPLQYGVNYPPRYGNHGAQMNNFRPCDMTVNTHPVGKSDTQFLESMPQPPLSHLGVEYGPLSKSSQFSGSSSSYLADGCKMLPPGQDSFRMQSIPEMSLHTVNRIVPMLPSLGSQCINFTPPRFGCANGVIQESPEKQETGGPSPTVEEELWSDNEHNFLDPEIGGVAVAPSHGSILIECAKRELHATTPLKKPDRNHPTRISLVFYQHKNLNEAKHGLAAWEAKMAEKAREKEEDAEKHGSDGTPSKSKKVKREASETPLHIEPLHKHFVQTPTQATMSCTTNTYVSTAPYAFTKTTGPYNRFI